eukprot:3434895-Lingulodinium_polyedra.AAC.1
MPYVAYPPPKRFPVPPPPPVPTTSVPAGITAGVGGVVVYSSTEKYHVPGGRPIAPPQHPLVLPYSGP